MISKGRKHLDRARSMTISLVVLMMVGLGMPLKGQVMPSWEETIEEYWQVNLPTSCAEEKVVRYRGFYNNGVSYIVFKYTEIEDIELISKQMDWKVKDYFIQQKAQKVLDTLEEWYEITPEENIKLGKYSKRLRNEYEYCYFQEGDGVSYSIFAWFKDLGELHVIELAY